MSDNNVCCRIYKEQLNLINQLPKKERAVVLLDVVNNAFYQFEKENNNQIDNQTENQIDNQIENQFDNAYISVSVSVYNSVSNISKAVIEILRKSIVCKSFSSNYGGSRVGAGKRKQEETKSKEPQQTTSRTHFIKPSLDEIKAYCAERNNNIDAQSFFDFYESKGWKIGNTPMKDWRAAVRTWERKTKEKENTTPINAPVNDILEFMLAHYEKKGISENPTLKARYIKQWEKTANDLVNACGGNIELAKTMIKLYDSKQTGEWYLWGVLNDYCGLYEELKRKHYVK